ncbi:receptor-like protein 9a [Gossypium arboreum]|uniref:Receptor-like protein 12 n=1 Tax=Gossypium arboreum TaxID=29729 RepID=A0ABR0QG78_GOSAR|nr:receptor-like protein 9a [Gossypium arboreum]KAK5838243.1 hypothetical protein PVK06_006971 [Gossypium arboreum]
MIQSEILRWDLGFPSVKSFTFVLFRCNKICGVADLYTTGAFSSCFFYAYALIAKAAWKNKGLHFYKNKASINSPEDTTFPNRYSEDCCQREAVECYASTTRVSRLIFHYQRDPSLLEHWYPNATLVAQFKDLKELELPGNNIKGFTSPHDLSYNQFSGSFPSLLVHNLTSIESLHLSNNLSIGKVSFSIFANLSRLGQLDISYIAHLELETEPQTWSPSFNMYVLKLAGCNLRKFPSFLSTQNNLKSLGLSDNFSAGTIPSWVMHNTTSQLWFSGNNLSDPFPEIFRNISSQLTSLDVSFNSFHGPLPEDINLIFPELVYIYANNNGFNGLIPPSFVRLNRLLSLDLSSNELDGEIPFFVTSNMSSLEILHLHQNKLRGYVLPRNSSLP